MTCPHIILAILGVSAIALSYWGLINWLTEGSGAGLPALLLGGMAAYLTQRKLLHE